MVFIQTPLEWCVYRPVYDLVILNDKVDIPSVKLENGVEEEIESRRSPAYSFFKGALTGIASTKAGFYLVSQRSCLIKSSRIPGHYDNEMVWFRGWGQHQWTISCVERRWELTNETCKLVGIADSKFGEELALGKNTLSKRVPRRVPLKSMGPSRFWKLSMIRMDWRGL